jgi:hypothetical protein
LPNEDGHEADQQQRHGEQLRPARQEESSGSGGFADPVTADDEEVEHKREERERSG